MGSHPGRRLSRLRWRRAQTTIAEGQGRAMPGVSIHVVDVSRGVVAAGMRVELFAVSSGAPRLIASGSLAVPVCSPIPR